MPKRKSTRPRSPRASIHQQIKAQRQRLFQAQAIVDVVRFALESKLEGLDDDAVGDALFVAAFIIDDACGALERVGSDT